MAGAALKLAGAATSSPFGKFHPYEGTYDSTVALWDGGYQSGGGVPANGSTLTNLVRDRMATVTGLSLAACDFSVINQTSSGFIAAERTLRGGIHVASTQAGAQDAAASFSFDLSPDFNNWLHARTDAGEDYAVLATIWATRTRDAGLPNSAIQALSWFAGSTSATTNYLYHTQAGRPAPNGLVTPGLVAGREIGATGTPSLLAVASQGWTGTKPSGAPGTLTACLLNIGSRGPWNGINYNKSPSFAFHRVQLDLVDLSDIAGADRAAKASAMIAAISGMQVRDFANGGRFAGDQYTPAATLKP